MSAPMDLYLELHWIQAQALIGRGIDSREYLALVAIETRLRTLETENARLRLELAGHTIVIEPPPERPTATAMDDLYAHPATTRHRLLCERCQGREPLPAGKP